MNTQFEAVTATFSKRVTYSEVDGLGYVHHSNAAIWFEQAREAYLRKFNIPYVALAQAGVYLAVRDLKVRFEEFVGYDDEIRVQVALTRLLRVSLELHYRVDNLRTGKLAVRGMTGMVAVEAKRAGAPPSLGRIRFSREEFLPRVVPVDALYPEFAGHSEI